MKKSCKHCGRVHEGAYTCHRKPPPRAKRRSSETDFRNTGAWKRKSAEIRERDRYLCRYCLSKGIVSYSALEVHHIEPLAERYDLRLDDDNLITLDRECHELAEAGGVPRGILHSLAAMKDTPRPFD